MKTAKLGSENVIWDLSALYASLDDPRIAHDMKTVRKDAAALAAKYRGKVAAGKVTAAELKKFLVEEERITSAVGRIGEFAELTLTTDNLDEKAKSAVMKAQELGSDISNQLVFFPIELGQMDEAVFARLVADKALDNYRHYLLFLRKRREHLLSEKEEMLINKRDLTGKLAIQRIYQELTSSFKYTLTVEGERKTMNGEQIRSLRENPDPKVRARAMKTYFDKYADNSLVITNVFDTLLKDHQIECELRHIDEPMGMRNLENELDADIVNTLSDVTKDNAGIVSRYYTLKARLLGSRKLSLADIYAPIAAKPRTYTWDDSKAIVLDAYAKFDKRAHDIIQEFFDKNWIDARTLPNKTGGAFCTFNLPGAHPWVMLNFTGTSRDVETMAHELGHGMHGVLSAKQTAVNRDPILPLAEVASVFGEMLVTDYLLGRLKDPEEKIALYCSKLESAFATTFRQNMFHRFEVRTHALIPDHQLSTDELRSIYHEELQGMFGDSVIIPKHYDMEWAIVQHMFMWPFYVYAYNFAQLVVLSLYQKYLEEGEKFKPVYYRILETGSAMTPAEILGLAGIDPRDKAFWQKGFDFMRTRWLEPLEKLVAERR
ncbi:MAG: M3 family oligoendopeptidase [Candidatus Cryosericum sp.]